MSQPRRSGRPLQRTTLAGPNARRDSLLVFAEGRNTEVGYLRAWHRQHREGILVDFDDCHGEPFTLVEAAVKARESERREERKGRGRAHDEYWCVFDRDEHPKFDAAVRLAGEQGICLAVSNPCLELWFVWHFEDQTAFVERAVVQRRSRQLLGCDKTLTASALQALAAESRYEDAKHRAALLDAKHEGDGSLPRSNPSSDIHCLVERIRRGTARRS